MWEERASPDGSNRPTPGSTDFEDTAGSRNSTTSDANNNGGESATTASRTDRTDSQTKTAAPHTGDDGMTLASVLASAALVSIAVGVLRAFKRPTRE